MAGNFHNSLRKIHLDYDCFLFLFNLTKNAQIGASSFFFFGLASIKLMQNNTLEWVNCVNDIMRKNGSAETHSSLS